MNEGTLDVTGNVKNYTNVGKVGKPGNRAGQKVKEKGGLQGRFV